MLKYYNTFVGFREIPDEITLCINLSNCPIHCQGCHSPWLWKDEGTPLYEEELIRLINKNKGISCVAFMGGDNDPFEVMQLAKIVKATSILKTAWYSGKQELPNTFENEDLGNFDYIKLGPYIQERGPLDNSNTNQRFYAISRISKLPPKFVMSDITYKFWKDDKH